MEKPKYTITEYSFSDIKDKIAAIYIGELTTLLETNEGGVIEYYAPSTVRGKYIKACMAFYDKTKLVRLTRESNQKGRDMIAGDYCYPPTLEDWQELKADLAAAERERDTYKELFDSERAQHHETYDHYEYWKGHAEAARKERDEARDNADRLDDYLTGANAEVERLTGDNSELVELLKWAYKELTENAPRYDKTVYIIDPYYSDRIRAALGDK